MGVSTEARGTEKARERIEAIVIVTVDRALPRVSPAYDLGVTEEERRQWLLRLTGRKA